MSAVRARSEGKGVLSSRRVRVVSCAPSFTARTSWIKASMGWHASFPDRGVKVYK